MRSMAHDEHAPRFTPSTTGDVTAAATGGGKTSNKVKNNKVPQRGMGVAQLEKIITERQLKDAGVLTPDANKLRRPAMPLPPPFPANRHLLISKSDVMNLDFVSRSMHVSSESGSGNNNWRGLYNFNGFCYESNPSIWSHSSSMVNVSSSSSIMNMQLEPPSIQSYCSNKYPSFNQDGDKMVGMKRSYPFSMENIPPTYVSPISKPDESTPSRRENPSSLGPTKDQKTKKFIGENPDLAKIFLTLAPPQPSHSRSKEKLLPSYQGKTRYESETELSNQQPLHSFFPVAKTQGNSSGEVVEHVDLNLKL